MDKAMIENSANSNGSGDSTKNEVLIFVARFARLPTNRIFPNSRVEADLGITGDDAWAFMEQFASRFGVSMTGFVHQDYFGPEGCNPLTQCWSLLFGKPLIRREITVQHLVSVAQVGCWLAPAQKSAS
jgi:hypothetical protein